MTHADTHTRFMQPTHVLDMLGVVHGMMAADLGAGSGAYTLALAERVGEKGKVYAVDIQKDLLRRIHNEARHRSFHQVTTMCADLETDRGTKIPDASVDVVILSNVLFQLDDKRAALREARRIVAPQGVVAIIDWNESYGAMGPHPRDVVHAHAAKMLAQESGLTFVRGCAAGAHHYLLIMKAGHTV